VILNSFHVAYAMDAPLVLCLRLQALVVQDLSQACSDSEIPSHMLLLSLSDTTAMTHIIAPRAYALARESLC